MWIYSGRGFSLLIQFYEMYIIFINYLLPPFIGLRLDTGAVRVKKYSISGI
jgi:hypothetical protein